MGSLEVPQNCDVMGSLEVQSGWRRFRGQPGAPQGLTRSPKAPEGHRGLRGSTEAAQGWDLRTELQDAVLEGIQGSEWKMPVDRRVKGVEGKRPKGGT